MQGGEAYMANKTNKTSSNNAKTKNMKYEVADEMGVTLGADATARENGSVGGQITKKLVQNGKKNSNY